MCIINGTFLPDAVIWLNNSGLPVTPSSLVNITTIGLTSNSIMSVLAFSSLKIAHSGRYECVARLGELIERGAFNVSVQCKYLFILTLKYDYVFYSKYVIFGHCYIS